MKTLEIPKSFSKIVKWLLGAVSPDDTRPALTGIHYRDGILSSADGFRIHSWRVDDEKVKAQLDSLIPAEKKDVVIESKLLGNIGKSGVWLVDELPYAYPNYNSAFPDPTHERASFYINRKYLLKALTELPDCDGSMGGVIVRLFDNRMVTVENLDCSAVALVMLMCQGVSNETKPADFSKFLHLP